MSRKTARLRPGEPPFASPAEAPDTPVGAPGESRGEPDAGHGDVLAAARAAYETLLHRHDRSPGHDRPGPADRDHDRRDDRPAPDDPTRRHAPDDREDSTAAGTARVGGTAAGTGPAAPTEAAAPPPAAGAAVTVPGDVQLPPEVRRWLTERRLLDERRRQVQSPQRALHELLAEHRSRIDRCREDLHRGLEAFDDVLRLLPATTPATRRETVEAEFFDDRARLRGRIEDLDALCQDQVLGMRTGFPERDVLEDGLESDLRMLERGVELRLLVSARALRRTGVAHYLSALMDHGAQVRVASTVPLHLNVVDRTVTVMAVGTGEGRDDSSGDVILHSPRLADCFARVFDHHWGVGRPATADVKPAGAGAAPEDYSPREREVLALLAAGAKDEAIARRLGCSERTLRRLLTALVGKLGADSRFAAGVQAVRLGLLD
ncbi:LuxR C-terminal-related transcriptional regulator [Streptomyces kanasensis]|uniref:helix-turn-helix transcriptional regulator n=1 Tax=Streptomyces kanasensis TaxID=936756 RepID=UPI0036FEFBE1